MLIKNYGLFFEFVYWGKQGHPQPGSLKGMWADGKEGVYDFRNQQGIYVLYDVNFNIVHVGQAGAGTTRLLYRPGSIPGINLQIAGNDSVSACGMMTASSDRLLKM